jgi:hypothetical protein
MDKLSHFILGVALILLACKSETTNGAKEEGDIIANGRDTTITFKNTEAGKLPAGWASETSTWSVVNEDENAALQMNKNGGKDFNIAVLRSHSYNNIEIEVRVKAISGTEDQGGGLVWRYIDSQNYYLVRANPLEHNIRLYKVVNGNRKQMKSKDIKMQTNKWFTIKVKTVNENIECFLDGEKMITDSDETFPSAGLVGFWSKADAVSIFDDLKIRVLN